MSARPNDLAMKQIGRLFRDGTVAGLGDGDLLARFVARRDETAFEALVSRHGPMVLGVCRRMLSDPHDADDAFQATFLVLVRKARGIRDANRLGPWLYGVAIRVAGRARVQAARRAKNETTETHAEPTFHAGSEELIDVRSIIDAELARLSAKHREVLVLCLLEGLSPDEAAARLRCPAGTIKSRLARGRETLKGRLTARGVTPAVVASAVLGSAEFVRASSVPERLLTPLLRAAVDPTGTLGSIGTGVVSLNREAMLPMIQNSMKLSILLVIGMGVGAVGVVEAVRSNALAQRPPVPAASRDGEPIEPGASVPQANAVSKPDAKTPEEQTRQHLREILGAFHQYHDVNNHLPHLGIHRPGGQFGLSWRVELLPYLGEGELYNQFHLEEPWNSPHNSQLVSRMPRVFETPDHPADKGQTRIRGFVADGTAFHFNVSFANVLDGTTNTALLGVGVEPVGWTTPEGIRVGPDAPLPQLEDGDTRGPLLGMMDGSIRRLKPALSRDRSILNALTSIAGGEVISSEIFVSAPTPTAPLDGGGSALPTPSATLRPPLIQDPSLVAPRAEGAPQGPNRSIEQRLEAIERKLDLLLQQSMGAGEAPNPPSAAPSAEPAVPR